MSSAVPVQRYRPAGAGTEEFVRRLVRTDVVYWDDLGQMHLTGAASEMLLHIIEQRACAGKPMLVTTQYCGRRMSAQFERPEMGEAISRRLNEFCRIVSVRRAEKHERQRFSTNREAAR